MTKTTIDFAIPISIWTAGAIALLVLVAVILWTHRDLARVRPLMRATLMILTILGALLAIGLLLNPTMKRESVDPQKPTIALVVDDSRSMDLADVYKGAAADWIRSEHVVSPGTDSPDAVKRIDLIRALLRPTPGSWLAEARDKYNVQAWRFAEKPEHFSLDDAALGKFDVDPEGHATAIGVALAEAAGGAGGATPSAIFLISDGDWNYGRNPVEVARGLGFRDIPVYVIGLGNPEPPLSVSVLALHSQQESFLGDVLTADAEVIATSVTPLRVIVELLDDERAVAEKQVMTLPGARPVRVELSYLPTSPGRRTLKARVRTLDDQTTLGKKEAETVVNIVDRKIRVLLIDAEPRWEFRFIRSVLERDPGVVSTICLLRPGIGPIKGPGYLSELPTDEKGFKDFDLVILGDVPRDKMPDAFLKALSEMVRIRGGALAVVAGRRNHWRELAGTPLEDILPVMLKTGAASGAGGQTLKPKLTLEGEANLLMRLDTDPDENSRIWSALPAMGWSADVGPLAHGATALLVHPSRLAGFGNQPILAINYVGTGKTFFSGVEETWRWRKSIGDKYHYRFWAQAIRWMVRKRFKEGELARLALSREECNVNEKVEVEASVTTRDGFPMPNAEVSVLITPEGAAGLPAGAGPGNEPQRIVLQAAPGGWGIYRGEFVPQKEGRFKFSPIVSAYGPAPLPSEPVFLQVTRPDLEKSYPAQDINCLQAIAAAGNGTYSNIGQMGDLKKVLAQKAGHRTLTEEYAPFRNRIYYALLAAMLSAAWFLRKRTGLA